MRPTISIVLPTFNGERFLDEAVESVCGQTFTDWELIIVDDCSNDQTPNIIEKYVLADERVKSIRHQVNRKLPAALNTGFAEASGEFLTWTSDDNLFRPRALETMLRVLKAHQDVGFVYAAMTIINDSGKTMKRRRAEPPNRLALKNPIGACFLYRREVYETIGGYSEKWFMAEDYDYWLRVSGKYLMMPIAEDLYLYRDHGRSLTNSHAERIERLVEQCFEENLPNVQWCGEKLLAQRYYRFANEAKVRGDHAICEKWLLRTGGLSPVSRLVSWLRTSRFLAVPNRL